MKFGPTALAEACGAILAHSIQAGHKRFKKGRVLSADDIDALRHAGIERITAARLEAGDVGEDEAAERLAAAVAGAGCETGAAFTGRANLLAAGDGLLVVDRARLDAVNRVSEDLTVATLAPFTPVAARQMIATVKIIPFAASGADLDACLSAAAAPLLRIAPFHLRRVALIQTLLPGVKPSVLDKTARVLAARLAPFGAGIERELRVEHEPAALDAAIRACDQPPERAAELVLIAGASAIVDRRDVIPAAIETAGGKLEHYGMPVDPGNLLLLAYRGVAPVIGLPGCARSPAYNGIDMLLPRLLAGLPVGREDIMALGAGGLLKETGGRGQPRSARPAASPMPGRAPRVIGVVLAAGRSRRMGERNKLLAEIDGQPMIRRVVETALASRLDAVVVVTGHQRGRVERALEGLALDRLLHNPAYRDGISSSLRVGLSAAGREPGYDAALICLGDMPDVGAADIDRLIAAFDPLEGRAICVPTHAGKRGNPVLWGRQFFAEMAELGGDLGARPLLREHAAQVCEVELDNRGVLLDVDAPQDLAVRQRGT